MEGVAGRGGEVRKNSRPQKTSNTVTKTEIEKERRGMRRRGKCKGGGGGAEAGEKFKTIKEKIGTMEQA